MALTQPKTGCDSLNAYQWAGSLIVEWESYTLLTKGQNLPSPPYESAIDVRFVFVLGDCCRRS